MTIIDRYLLVKFVKVFAICFLSTVGLYIVFDTGVNWHHFELAAGKHGSVLDLISEYYAYRSVFFFEQQSGILVLSSTMFTVAWMQRNNELLALGAAGLSRRRVLMPVFAGALVIILLTTAIREFVLPPWREVISRPASDLLGEKPHTLLPRYDLETGILIRGESAMAKDLRITRPSFLLPPKLEKYGRHLAAENAFYMPPKDDRPGGYLFKGVSKPEGICKQPSLVLDGERIIFTPKDAPDWLAEDECFVRSNVRFDQIVAGRYWRMLSSLYELITGLSNPSLQSRGDIQVAVHARIVQPLLDLTLMFLGLPLVLSWERRNMFASIGICVLVTIGFLLVVMALKHFGSIQLLSPALAVWIPLILFVPIAVSICDPLWE